MLNRFKSLLTTALLTTVITGCSAPGPTKNFTPNTIPKASAPSQSSIQQTRQVIVQELGKKQGIALSNSGPNYQRVNNLVRRLSRAAGLGSFSYPVFIGDAGKQVNAMAVNGNTIVVYTELLRRVPNDNELAAVVGHEIAHIISKDHADTTAQSRAAGVQIGAAILGGLIGARAGSNVGDLTTNIAGTLGDGYFVKSYGREMEYEADHTGMLIMAKAGYNPQGAIKFWGNASKIFGSSGGGSDFLSTHPSEGRRLARLRASLPTAMTFYRP